MNSDDKFEIDIAITVPEHTTLRVLEGLRLNLATLIKSDFQENELDLYQEPTSRSLDPVVVGAIALAISPTLVQKLSDLLIFWAGQHKDDTVTLSIPIKGADPIKFTYNPNKTDPETLKKWVIAAVDAVKAGKAR